MTEEEIEKMMRKIKKRLRISVREGDFRDVIRVAQGALEMEQAVGRLKRHMRHVSDLIHRDVSGMAEAADEGNDA